jgi:DNA-binding NarL/FixJ family response regulator
MNVLLIDDVRSIEFIQKTYNIKVTEVARTYQEGIDKLQSGNWDILCLDHDLGEKKSGYDIMNYLETYQEYLPKKIVLVTSNPVGRGRMQMVIDNLYNA